MCGRLNLCDFFGRMSFTRVVLKLLTPQELQLIVVGSPTLDFAAFEEAAVYEDGFSRESPVIRERMRSMCCHTYSLPV